MKRSVSNRLKKYNLYTFFINYKTIGRQRIGNNYTDLFLKLVGIHIM